MANHLVIVLARTAPEGCLFEQLATGMNEKEIEDFLYQSVLSVGQVGKYL